MLRRHHALETVALLRDDRENGLLRGQVGTIVEELRPGVFEVEFADNDGRTFATVAVPASQLLGLRYAPVKAA